jgi:hypothetical protein
MFVRLDRPFCREREANCCCDLSDRCLCGRRGPACRGNRWWRRGELNPRPRAVKPGYYMLSSPLGSRPRSARRAGNDRGPASVVFDVRAETVRERLAHIDDIRTRRREQPSDGRSRVFRPRGRVRCCSQLLSFDQIYEVISSACNHDPDMSPSKPVRPQIVNDRALQNRPAHGSIPV